MPYNIYYATQTQNESFYPNHSVIQVSGINMYLLELNAFRIKKFTATGTFL